MTGFIQRKIVDEEKNIGEQLRRVRIEKGEDIEAIAGKVEIKKEYLQALEENNYQNLPGDVYVENFLRIYSQYLGLDPVKLLAVYHKAQEPLKIFKEKKFKKERVIFTPKFFKISVLISVLLVVLIYMGILVAKSIMPPRLTIITPSDNLVTADKEIEIFGQTEKNAQVTINGQLVFCNENGEFREKFVLQEGINVIEISAAKKHSREKVVLRTVLVK